MKNVFKRILFLPLTLSLLLGTAFAGQCPTPSELVKDGKWTVPSGWTGGDQDGEPGDNPLMGLVYIFPGYVKCEYAKTPGVPENFLNITKKIEVKPASTAEKCNLNPLKNPKMWIEDGIYPDCSTDTFVCVVRGTETAACEWN